MRSASRHGSSRLAAALFSVSLVAGLQLGLADSASAAVTAGPVFNKPTGTVAEQQAIRTQLLDYINQSPSGSSIKASVYHFWDTELAQAIADARARGVDIQLMLDESDVSDNVDDPTYPILTAALGTDLTKSSFVGLCPVNKSCLGEPSQGASINHNKFWLFSQLDGAYDVVVQTSSNLTPSSYSRFWNDAYVLPNNVTIYTAYSNYFGKLVGQDWANWQYSSTTSSPYKAYFFPRPADDPSPGDTITGVLDNVTCTYTENGTTKHTKVRVGMFKLTRLPVAQKLVALKTAGCTVDIVYSQTDSGSSSGTWETLHASGGPTLRCYNWDDDNDPATASRIIHSKYLLIEGKYDGATGQKVLWTGSHNYTGPALTKNDEALLKVDVDADHDAYVTDFNAVKAAAVPGTADNTNACKGIISTPET
ncbi:phospholipase D-like domain-containing protein [Streptomyces sp. NBC_00576]|uniref:phospholipase D-like domain-containing protein n=1 Tax=Streptomyces sp. NBC_00576 TaxID=2903665 RepID=UPI002E822368|nr:phospholipase D-like domain-containing protein [Streptomyces sp. NBC_00576]WUB68635.1 phospholipase D-like domain-containing protein [Streptomyces sp. NBC_00576]WUB77062.1 phospholipase D-like domain-containing protein [Streptomyces sp. NBC_00576]